MTERTRNAYDHWAKDYDSDPNPQILLEYENVVSLVAPSLGERILDAACGTGRYTSAFYLAGTEVVGIDFSKEMIAVAKTNFPNICFEVVDLMERLPFDRESFDKINCAQALKHLPNLSSPLMEFSRILKKGGKFIFSVTHPDMDWEGYELIEQPGFILSLESDIFHHRFCDYFSALQQAGLFLDRLVQVPVSNKIKDLLTPDSYEKVKGRYQILIIRAEKSGI